MSILRTRTPQATPATAATLEPFRLMRDFLRWDPLLDYGPGAPAAFMPSARRMQSAVVNRRARSLPVGPSDSARCFR